MIYGVEPLNEETYGKELVNLVEETDLGLDPYTCFEKQLYHKGNPTLYFMSILLRRKHLKAKREMSTFALAFGSKHKIVQNCKELMLKYLNVIFDQTNQANISPEKEQDHI